MSIKNISKNQNIVVFMIVRLTTRGKRLPPFPFFKKCLRRKWLNKIPTDFSTWKNPAISIKHFNDSDIINTDKCVVAGVLKDFRKERSKLKADPIPTIFNNVPKYLSETPSPLNQSNRLYQGDEENVLILLTALSPPLFLREGKATQYCTPENIQLQIPVEHNCSFQRFYH